MSGSVLHLFYSSSKAGYGGEENRGPQEVTPNLKSGLR